MPWSNHEGLGLCLRSLEHIMGESDKATTPETMTEPAKASANSANSRPVRPGVNAKGANTATSVMVMATTAKPISLTPLMAAANGSIPCSI